MADQPILLPEPTALHHQVEIAADRGPWSGMTRRYRGARIEANDKDTVFGLFMPDHPMDGINMGNWENMLPLVDAWLEDRDAPRATSAPPTSRTRRRTPYPSRQSAAAPGHQPAPLRAAAL